MPSVSASPPRTRLLAWLGAAWLLATTLSFPSATRLDVWPWAGIGAAGWLTCAVAAVALLARNRLVLPVNRISLGVGLFGAVVVLSAWFSPWAPGSLAASLTTLGGVGLLLLLFNAFSQPESTAALRRALDLCALALICAALLGWIRQAATAPSLGALLHGRNAVPFGHSVYTAGAALLAGSWLGASALRVGGPARRWRLAGVGGALLVVISSASRAGVVMAGVAAFLLAIMWWLRRGRQTRDAVVGAVALVAIATIGIGTNPRLRDLVLEGRWNPISTASNQHRLAMADAGISLGGTHGLLGPGPGTVPLAYHAGNARVPDAPDGSLQLHSLPLQIWATTGPVGSAALLVLLLALAPTVLRGLRTRAPPDANVHAAALIIYGLFSLTDHQFDLPFILTFVLAHLTALSLVVDRPPASPAPSVRVGLTLLALALLAGPMWYRVRDLTARAAFADAASAHDAGQSDEVQRALSKAIRRAPWDRFYHEAAAAWSWNTNAESAAEHLRAALQATPAWPSEFATYNLAWLELARGSPDAASLFARAASLAPQRTGVFLGRGFAITATGDQTGADDAFARHLLADPRSIALSLWEQPGLRERRPAILARIHELATSLAGRTTDPVLVMRLRETAILLAWWWEDDDERRHSLLAGLSPGTRAPLEALVTAPAAGSGPWEGSARWGLLAETWASGRPSASAPETWTQPLEARLATEKDFATFVTAAPSEDVFRRAYRVGRGGYRVVMRHPASPELFDFPAFEENLLLAPHLNVLFSARGWIPGALWRALDARNRPDELPSDR